MGSHLLSKTSFLKAVQCDKAFFLYKNHYDLKDPLSPEKLSIFNRGHKVGLLAQELFPGGVDASPAHAFKYTEALEKTKQLIEQGQHVIYEAAFIYDDTLVAIDILVRQEDKWYAYEVKSSLKISQAYVMDAALQYYVIKNALPALEDISLVTLNSQYRMQDKIDVHKLFRIQSVKKDAEKNTEFMRHHIRRAKEIHARDQLPDVKVGAHCFYPYSCDFMGICWKHMPSDNVYELSGTSKQQLQEWYEMGYKTIGEIPEHLPAGGMRLMIDAYKKNTELVNREEINSFFGKITYPLAFLDMEFYTPAIPKYQGSAPFELSPFLFSWLGLGDEKAQTASEYFFHEENSRPELPFIQNLVEKAEKVNSILVYDTGQENQALNRIAALHPGYNEKIRQIKKKLIDLSEPFQKLWYYHPDQKCSLSQKKIYQAIFGRDAYARMPVHSGMLASYRYDDLLNETDLFKRQETKENLIHYCCTDTQVMFELFLFLRRKSSDSSL